jgi:pseudaminic acid cytidylyltransferase
MRLAVIPARGGSKRIPRKNIKPFGGIPMIAWSIRAAIDSECFDRIVVSTDDAEIADIANKYGAETPFIRPANISDDYTGTAPVIAHAIEWQNQNGQFVSEACCIYPAAPFIQAQHIQTGYAILDQLNVDFAFSAASFASPIQRAFRITAANRAQMFQPENFEKRSQDLEPAFYDAAQFYWGRSSSWLLGKCLFSEVSAPVLVPRHCVHDIDTTEDWQEAETFFNYLKPMHIKK